MIMDGSDRMEDIVNSFLDYLIIDKKYSDNTKKSYEEELKKLAQQEKVQFLENSQFLKEKENPFTTDGIHPQPYFFHLWGRHMASYLNNN